MSTTHENWDEVSVNRLSAMQHSSSQLALELTSQQLQKRQQRQKQQRKRLAEYRSNRLKERLLKRLILWRHESSSEMIERVRGMKRLEAHKIPIWVIPVIAFVIVLFTIIFIYLLAAFVTLSIAMTTPPTISATGAYIPELYIYCFVCNWAAVLFFILSFAKFWQLQVVRRSLYRYKVIQVLFMFVNLNVLFWGLLGSLCFGLQAAFSQAAGSPHGEFAVIFFGAITFHILFVGIGDVILFAAIRSKWKMDVRRHKRHNLPEERDLIDQPNGTEGQARENESGVPTRRRLFRRTPKPDLRRSRFDPKRGRYVNVRRKYLPVWLILYRFLVTVALFGCFIVLAYSSFLGPTAPNQELLLSIFEYVSVALQMIFLVSYCYDFYVFELAVLMSERAKTMKGKPQKRSIFSAQSTGHTPMPIQDVLLMKARTESVPPAPPSNTEAAAVAAAAAASEA